MTVQYPLCLKEGLGTFVILIIAIICINAVKMLSCKIETKLPYIVIYGMWVVKNWWVRCYLLKNMVLFLLGIHIFMEHWLRWWNNFETRLINYGRKFTQLIDSGTDKKGLTINEIVRVTIEFWLSAMHAEKKGSCTTAQLATLCTNSCTRSN